ncbi:histidine--tRNA ligase [Candidatus Wolfebacteria bacterium]|nr:histidine--tRNA ligase [Candidatus Wolfebacteria bacterium]
MKNKKAVKKEKVFLQSSKGMRDILPADRFFWNKVRNAAFKIAESFNFLKIETPILEHAAVFERTGASTDIVEKQMFFVKSKGGDKLVLRPELTAPVMRAYFQHGLSRLAQPLKLFYLGPVFRYEQPQSGRLRQHYQTGFEILGGSGNPIYDAMIILILFRLLEDIKIKNLTVQINSIGCKVCRAAYIKKLQEYYKKNQEKICKDCKRRLAVRPLRLLDCKNEKCALIKSEAPIIIDKICNNCKKHFKAVLEYLDELSLPYMINNYLVRGLDYYNGPVFEIVCEANSNMALASGGRYDYLSEMLGNNKVFAVGGSMGLERAIEAMKNQGIEILPKGNILRPDVFLIHIGEEAKKKNLIIFEELRKVGIKIMESFEKDSLNSQIRIADKVGALLTLILGQKEVFEESIIIRNMKTGNQETVPLIKVVDEVKKRL